METRITRKDLVGALSKVVGILNPTPTIPALNHVLIEAGGENLQFTATDLEVTVRTRVQVKPAGKGKVLVPGRKLFDLARESSESEISLVSEKDTQLRYAQDGSSVCLVGLKPQDFPAVSTDGEAEKFTLSAQSLSRGINLTRTVVSVNENKPNISGIYITTEDGWLTMVGTDTKRLSRYRSKTNLKEETGFLLPVKAADMIRSAWEEKEQVAVGKGEKLAIFRGRDTEIICQLINAQFPNYRQVIPAEESLTVIEVPRSRMISSLRRIHLIVSAGRNVARLEFQGGRLIISGETSGLGEGREEIEIDYQGEPLVMNFQPDFLLDGLRNIEEEETCRFHLNPDTERPSMLTSKKDTDYLYLIMPIKA